MPTKAESAAGCQRTWPIMAPFWSQAVMYWVPLRLAVRPNWVTGSLKVTTPA
ncbi:hypothetical protein ENSA5_45220 [Enhygromyxa salina]|uniref:Uncharacterized protein n=1 Tax=Enhygromyxa salina TaxID=215803 RepID=A0A2S9XJS7_9BACT|nr:hypothetical protein ENSA5_45220 [Enhygromyxa salina]